MKSQLRTKLLSLAERCESLAAEIRAALLVVESEKPLKRNRQTEPEITAKLEQLKQYSREDAQNVLTNLSQIEVGKIYRALGGSSNDAKKPKDFVVGRILWQLFDFRAGHDLLQQQKPNLP